MYERVLLLISVVLLLAFSTVPAAADYEVLTGNYWSHDPVMTRQGNTYYSFCTGQKTPIRTSTDMHNWQSAGYVWPTLNAVDWWVEEVPGFADTSGNYYNIWAPDISYFNSKYHLYYSISSWGSNDSCIGLATRTTLGAGGWTDEGPVICSEGTNYNAIDPALFIDTSDTPTTYWLAFGSFWSGIKLTQINPATGHPVSSPPVLYSIASRGGGAIEAPFIVFKDGYYYLFVSFDSCCQEPYTYNIRVGRATSVTGPYYDRFGVSMMSSGGNRLTWGNESWKGPGHNAVFLDNDGRYWLVHHAYRMSDSWAGLRIHELFWDSEDWPTLAEQEPVDVNEALVAWWKLDEGSGSIAEDYSSNNYDGTITGAAWAIDDPDRNIVLSFDGTDDYVDAPDGFAFASFDGLTISLWAYPTNSAKSWARFIDFGNGSPSNNIVLGRRSTSNDLVFDVWNGTTDISTVTAAGAIELNKWQHFAATLDVCGYAVLYKNGLPIKAGATSPPWNVTRTNNYIARSNWTGHAYYQGRLDDIRLYNKTLDANDIKGLYRQGLASGTCSLVRSHGFGLVPDWTKDCYVDFYDWAFLADAWLNDLDWQDFADFAMDWLRCNNPPDANCPPNW